MLIFTTLLGKLIPLYLLIALGFVAVRFLGAQRETIASLLLYLIAPGVIFSAMLATPLTPRLLGVPFVFFSVGSLICLLALDVARRLWRGPAANIVAFASGSGNTGYFGFPVVILLFGQESLGLAALVTFGIILFENTVGFFVTARGGHTIRESLAKVARLPTVYAFLAGAALSLAGVRPTQAWTDLAASFRGAYTVLGMMLIGVGLGSMRRFELDWRFISVAFVSKFVLWPAVIFSLVALDARYWRLVDEPMHRVMMLLSIVPLPANTVAVATHLKAEPEKAAMAVLASTVFALFYIPWISAYWF